MSPTIKIIGRLKICMFSRREHGPPHVHVYYAEYRASINVCDLSVMTGELPGRQYRRTCDFIAEHRSELLEMWQNRLLPGGIYSIDD